MVDRAFGSAVRLLGYIHLTDVSANQLRQTSAAVQTSRTALGWAAAVESDQYPDSGPPTPNVWMSERSQRRLPAQPSPTPAKA